MQVLITHGSMARTRVLQFQRWQMVLALLALTGFLMMVSGLVYHFVFLKAAREGWPVVSTIIKPIVSSEIAQRDRFMRDNLDAMAEKVGQMQAKLIRLEAMGERVSGLAGVKADDLKPAPSGAVVDKADSKGERKSETGRPGSTSTINNNGSGGRGGPYVPNRNPSLQQLQTLVGGLDEATDFNTDLFTLIQSRLLESRLKALMVPSSPPLSVAVGSGFGFRSDPFNGRLALHTGLDFPAEAGSAIHAAAGGLVVTRTVHADYGQMIEIDHGNGLVTRYAHCSAIDVELGALVKRGQPVARVGNTGRSTGAHLHFEVLVDGVHQDPARFLAAAEQPSLAAVTSAATSGSRPARR
jgi:murein DD-endopeptidase MepM/ murein hydrolase activator NlpD